MVGGGSESWASSEAVRRSMQSNRATETAPEILLRSKLHQAGLRFRKNHRIDLGEMKVRPDVVFTRRRIAVFLDGCFWHRCPEHGSDPKRNQAFWKRKLDRNVERDRKVDLALLNSDWIVLRYWEHEPIEEAAEEIAQAVYGAGS